MSHDALGEQFAHLKVPVHRVQAGDLVRPLYPPGARFEQATGNALHDPDHPMHPDMFVVPYGRRLGPHTPANVRHEIYRRKS